MVQLLIDNPLLVLVLVAATGYAAGQIKVAGTSLGIAAVLFVGLLAGALDPRLKLPDAFYLLGLVVFVYTVGLSSGPTFFGALRRQGLRNNLLCLGVLVLGAGLLVVLQRTLGLPPALVAEGPLGWMPRYEDLDWNEMDRFTPEQFHALMAIDRAAWVGEIQSHEELFARLYDRLPKELIFTRELILSSLWRSPERWEI